MYYITIALLFIDPLYLQHIFYWELLKHGAERQKNSLYLVNRGFSKNYVCDVSTSRSIENIDYQKNNSFINNINLLLEKGYNSTDINNIYRFLNEVCQFVN